MRRSVIVVLAAGVGVLLHQTLDGLRSTAEAGPLGGGCSVENARHYSADADGNSRLELTDAVRVLRFLFADGPEPPCLGCDQLCEDGCQACVDRVAELEAELETCRDDLGAMAAALAAAGEQLAQAQADLRECEAQQRGLPATGLTLCYGQAGQVVPCDGDTCPGQDAAHGGPCPMEDRFVDHGDGTVTDRCTGLMWQKAVAPGSYDWCGAVTYCDELTLAERDDWRLPNVRELQSIVDYGLILPAHGSVFESAFSPREYWSSTSGVNVPHRAWAIDFGDGLVGGADKTARFRVRAVRGGL